MPSSYHEHWACLSYYMCTDIPSLYLGASMRTPWVHICPCLSPFPVWALLLTFASGCIPNPRVAHTASVTAADACMALCRIPEQRWCDVGWQEEGCGGEGDEEGQGLSRKGQGGSEEGQGRARRDKRRARKSRGSSNMWGVLKVHMGISVPTLNACTHSPSPCSVLW